LKRLALVDALRFFSLLVVLAVHLASAEVVVLPPEGLARDLWLDFARNGSYGVTLFFVISGFVITRTLLERETDLARLDIRAFYVRRFARIAPALATFVLLGALAWTTVDGDTAREAFTLRHPAAAFDSAFWLSIPTLVFNWLLIARETVTAPGFGLHWDVLWSLAIEEQFYLAYPWLLRKAGSLERAARWIAIFVVLGPLSRYVAHVVNPESFLLSYVNSFAGFEQIAMGALVCCALHRKPAVRSWDAFVAALGVVGLVVVYWKTTLAYSIERVYGPTLLGLAASVTLYFGLRGAASVPSAADGARGAAAALLTTPGQWSYGGYLAHALVLFALWPTLYGRSAWSAFALYGVTTFAVAGLSFRFFEEPANKTLRRSLGLRKGRPSAM
jgi:peptidoglycan/LPS O-acetylase OafA/YrhL